MGQELSKRHCSLSHPSLTDSTTTHRSGLLHPVKYLRLHPLQHNRCVETKKYGPNERTDQNSIDEEIANLSDAKIKMLVIRMLREIFWDNFKFYNIPIIGVSKGEKEEQ